MEAPFKVGQKVVCIETTMAGFSRKVIKESTELTVRKCYDNCVFFDEVINPPVPEYFQPSDNYEPAYHVRQFAPLPEQRERINYVAVSETMRETAVETFITQTN